jgi:hypothetical protein
MEEKWWSTGAQHITGLYMLRSLRSLRGSGRLGHFATLQSHAALPPQFVGPKNSTHFSIRAAKPSYTAETVCAMRPKISHKFLK